MIALPLIVNIEPVAWQRVKRGRFGQAYVPNETRKYKADLAKLLKKEFPTPLDGPVFLVVSFVVRKPKSVKRLLPCVRPDLDNYIKAFKDAANGVLWKDDGQVVTMLSDKRYTPGSGRIEVTVQSVP